MEISELTLKLIIILIPGAIASRIYQKITIHDKWTSFRFIANSILFGSFSYLITDFFIEYTYCDKRLVNFWNNLPSSEIPYDLILKTCLTALVIGFTVSAIDHFKLLNWFARTIRISKKYGDENLYSYFLNAKEVGEVYIRDGDNNATYHGIVFSFSETKDLYEIVLSDVAVYSNDPYKLMYEADKIYLSRAKTNITIELPFKTNENGEATESTSAPAS